MNNVCLLQKLNPVYSAYNVRRSLIFRISRRIWEMFINDIYVQWRWLLWSVHRSIHPKCLSVNIVSNKKQSYANFISFIQSNKEYNVSKCLRSPSFVPFLYFYFSVLMKWAGERIVMGPKIQMTQIMFSFHFETVWVQWNRF